ncbi:hypothetical protein D6783_05945 [Candidatus Woesearchaeota archaeon]|nr:MAG: hypothetical protein D6783_05945 [Candidatus Woesearchaeota archaeon]
MAPDELASLTNKHSPARAAFSQDLHLPSLAHVDPFRFDPTWNVQDYHIPRKQYDHTITEIVERLGDELTRENFPPSLETAVFEAVRNAHQHGHQGNPSKPITIGYRIIPGTEEHPKKRAQIAVSDRGGTIHKDFLPYILHLRQLLGKNKEEFLQTLENFYFFSDKEKKTQKNWGLGTSLMHAYAQRVEYFANEHGGLVVVLTFNERRPDR